jgi:hypothetical protein
MVDLHQGMPTQGWLCVPTLRACVCVCACACDLCIEHQLPPACRRAQACHCLPLVCLQVLVVRMRDYQQPADPLACRLTMYVDGTVVSNAAPLLPSSPSFLLKMMEVFGMGQRAVGIAFRCEGVGGR